MITKLLRICQDQGLVLQLNHHPINDFRIDVVLYDGTKIVSFESCDIDRAVAEAYAKTTDWLVNKRGGY